MHETSASAMDSEFTDDALALLAEANREAARLRHEYIGTEHIVLALTDRDVDVVTAALERIGVDRRHVHQSISGIVSSGRDPQPPEMKRPFTSRTKSSIAFAAERARAMGQPRIAPEHLLLGLLREKLNIGAQVLHEHGLTVETATQAIEQVRRPDGSD
jgi:ATP-dependent Clp protease ATP-binding subunit ClpC